MIERDRLIAFLAAHPETTAASLQAAGFSLGAPIAGRYRRTYPIPAAGAVLKIPRGYRAKPGDAPWRNPRQHALIEIETTARIRSDDALRHLRKYTGEIYWSDKTTGLILMKAYGPRARGPLYRREAAIVVDIFRESLCKWTADYGLQNLLRDEDMTPIVVDLGY